MKLFFAFLLLFIFSCSSKHEIPNDILSQPKMQSILWDMLKADEFVSNYGRKDSTRSLKDKSTLLYEEIFNIHKTTKSQFEKSITFYSQHPDLFKSVLDSMEKQKPMIMGELYKSHSTDSLHNKKTNLPASHK
jgi:uncharacterized protein DUF4296